LLFLRKSQHRRSQADYFKIEEISENLQRLSDMCRETLDGVAVRQKSGVYRCALPTKNQNTPRMCSFCGDSMQVAGKLLSSPLDGEHCYICPLCVSESQNAISQPAREPLWFRLVRLIRRTGGSKFMDLSGSGQQLT